MDHAFFSSNRERFQVRTGEGIAIATAFTQIQRSNDSAGVFEQEANFWYLTGIEAPDWWLIIDGKSVKSWLVQPEIDEIHQTFDGSLDAETAKKISGIDDVISQSEALEMLGKMAQKNDTVFTIGKDPHSKFYDFTLNPAQDSMEKRLKSIFKNVKDCRTELAKLRAIKQPVEIEAMKKAVNLTVNTFKDVKKKLPSLKHEYEVEAEFTYSFRKNGAKGHAYEPIVACGKNACTLHYIDNNSGLNSESLLLIDIGAKVGGYAADVTRTYAIGNPTPRQIEVHETVEKAQQDIISLLKPGLSVKEYHEKVDEIMKAAIKSLGLIKKPEDYRRYFPHAVSHGLGIDVHDPLCRPIEFMPGMVITVEPGIYIPEEEIGVRIEDDILITDDGCVNLSGALSTSL
jgi:Xaa-Pro aminopeptidase